MPFVERERYQIPSNCRLHPSNDLFRDQEEHKVHVDINEWKCGYCQKSFRAEKYLDQHFDNRHRNLLNVVCGLLFVALLWRFFTYSLCWFLFVLQVIWRKNSCFRVMASALLIFVEHCIVISFWIPSLPKPSAILQLLQRTATFVRLLLISDW